MITVTAFPVNAYEKRVKQYFEGFTVLPDMIAQVVAHKWHNNATMIVFYNGGFVYSVEIERS